MRLRAGVWVGRVTAAVCCLGLLPFLRGAQPAPADDRAPLPVRVSAAVKWTQVRPCTKEHCGGCQVEGSMKVALSATLDGTAGGFLFEPVKKDGKAGLKLTCRRFCPTGGQKDLETADQEVVLRAPSTQAKRPTKVDEGLVILTHQPWGSGDQLLGDGRTPRPLPAGVMQHRGEWEYHVVANVPFTSRNSRGEEHLRWVSFNVVGNRRPRSMSGSKGWSITGGLGEPWTFPITVVQTDYANEGRPSDNTDPEDHKPKLSYDVNWTVGHEDVELVVEPKGYEKWRPKGSKSELEPGNRLSVRAYLKDPGGGGKPKKTALAFTFELLDVSQEPGTAINFPASGADTSFDLKFWPADQAGPNPSVTNRLQRLHYSGEKLTEATAVIACHDWGAWGTLKVTAIADDGQELVGYLEGHKGTTEVLLPKRKESSKLADHWKEAKGVGSSADDADDEDEPEGDGRGGDGLTLYEEYRGFYEDGEHRCGDVKKKDFFIYDKMGGRSKDGIALLASASGLAVHHEFTAAEFDEGSRVINRNRDKGPHRIDQHGIILGLNDLSASRAVGGPGPPKQVTFVGICPEVDPGEEGWSTVNSGRSRSFTDLFAATVAHELLHACSVWHHGGGDHQKVRWRIDKNELGLNCFQESRSGGPWQEVRILREDGTALRPRGEPPAEEPWLGREHGQHSGCEDCLMRYDCSSGYVSKADAAVRYFVENELTGIGLCSDGRGSGVNASGRRPQSRYGDAAPRRGDCRRQICVNDALGVVNR